MLDEPNELGGGASRPRPADQGEGSKIRKWLVRRRDSPLFVAIFAAIVGAICWPVGAAVVHHFTDPPGIGTLTHLMDEEATGSMAHQMSVVLRIYAPGAVVTDAGCRTRGAGQTWQGYGEIVARYSALPKILSLHHIFASVAWEPANSRAETATVTATTIGVIEVWPSPPQTQSLTGHELWTFAHVNGKWLVTSFTYNLCLS